MKNNAVNKFDPLVTEAVHKAVQRVQRTTSAAPIGMAAPTQTLTTTNSDGFSTHTAYTEISSTNSGAMTS